MLDMANVKKQIRGLICSVRKQYIRSRFKNVFDWNSLLENIANYVMNKLILTKTILSKEIWKVRVYVIQFPSLHQGCRAQQPKDNPVQNKINLLTLTEYNKNSKLNPV